MRDGYTQRFVRRILDNDRYALIAVVVFMLMPYTAWASMTILSLVTLRKGWKQASLLLIPAITAHILVSLTTVVWTVACVDALIRVLPCFAAACVLRKTHSWKAVAALFFCLVMLCALSLQVFAPHLIDAQLVYLQTAMRGIDSGRTLLDLWGEWGIQPFVVANYLLGFQGVCLLLAIISPLLFARSLQAQLYYPGGFRQEMLNFRGDKYSVLVMVLLAVAASLNHVFAMNGLPLMMFYFTLAGLSVSAHVLEKMKPLRMAVVLLVPFMLLPLIVLPFYIALGTFDSLFNFRLYLSSRAGKTM